MRRNKGWVTSLEVKNDLSSSERTVRKSLDCLGLEGERGTEKPCHSTHSQSDLAQVCVWFFLIDIIFLFFKIIYLRGRKHVGESTRERA